MDSKKYSVDDILNEVRMKKLSRESGPEAQAPSVPDQPKSVQPEPAAHTEPVRQNPSPASADAAESRGEYGKSPEEETAPLRRQPGKTVQPPNSLTATQRIRFDSEEFKNIFQTDELPVKRGRDRNVFEPEKKGKEKRNFVVSIPNELDDDEPEAVLEKAPEGTENTKKKKIAFFNGSEEEAPREEEKAPEGEIIDDFNSYADAPSVLRDLKMTRNSVVFRLAVTAITGLFLLYMNVATSYGLPFPKSLHPAEEPLLFTAISLVLTLIAVISCIKMIAGGVGAALTFKPNNDSIGALAVTACLGQNIAALFVSGDWAGNRTLFSGVAVLGLAFNLLGKQRIISRILRNFRFVSSPHEKYAVEIVDSKAINTSLISRTEGNVTACSGRKAGFLSSFLEHSYSTDASDALSRVLAPLSILGGLTVAAGCYFTYDSLYKALIGFSATVCICSPFAAVLSCNGPLLRLTKKLQKCGGMVAGSSSIEELSGTNVLLVKEKELVVPAFAHLHGIKTFGGSRIDESIIYAASMVCTADGTLAEVFLQVIEGRRDLLLPAENLSFENGMGISAFIEDRQTFFGSRSLMQEYGIDVPSKDYEARYSRNGRDLLYLAVSGELCAMFVISYKADEEFKYAVQCLEYCDVKIGIKTTDPNLTADKLAEVFEVEKDTFVNLEPQVYHAFDQLDEPREKASAMAAYLGGFEAYSRVIVGVKQVKSSIGKAVLLQALSVVLGYALAAFIAIFSGIGQLNPLSVLGYQLFFTLLITIFPSLTKMD